METLQKLLGVITTVGLLFAAAGCGTPLDLKIQRNRIFLLGRLLAGKTCDIQLIWRKAPDDFVPVTVTAALSQIGGEAEQALAPGDNDTWRWTGQVTPDVVGERIITITVTDQQEQTSDIKKMFRVFNADKAIAIAAGGRGDGYGLALKFDGTVAEWNFSPESPYAISSGLTDVIAIAAGGWHQLALKADGTVTAWGCDSNPEFDYGQCDIPEGLNDVVAIAAGGTHSIALKADGTVIAWGMGMDLSDYGTYLPIYVPAGLTDVVAIGAGESRSAAVKADGTLVPWPHNYELSDVVSVSFGVYFDLPVQSDGTVVQIYNQAHEGKAIALPIRAGKLEATATASGEWHNIALQQNGSVVVWKIIWDNRFGAMVFHRLNNIIAVAAAGFGGSKYMALSEDGSVIVWEEKMDRKYVDHAAGAR